jgi:hypothetical protein
MRIHLALLWCERADNLFGKPLKNNLVFNGTGNAKCN